MDLLKCQKHITTHDGSKHLRRKTPYLVWRVHYVLDKPYAVIQASLFPSCLYLKMAELTHWDILRQALCSRKYAPTWFGRTHIFMFRDFFFFMPPGPNAVPGLLTFGQLHVLDHMLLPTFLCSDSGVAFLKANHEQPLTPACSLLTHCCSFEYLYVVSAQHK